MTFCRFYYLAGNFLIISCGIEILQFSISFLNFVKKLVHRVIHSPVLVIETGTGTVSDFLSVKFKSLTALFVALFNTYPWSTLVSEPEPWEPHHVTPPAQKMTRHLADPVN
jgi:hypothetical protein